MKVLIRITSQISILNMYSKSYMIFMRKNDQYNISDAVQYVNSNELRETLISLEQYSLNDEPYENEIDDYVNVINENGQETIESLNHKLRKLQGLAM